MIKDWLWDRKIRLSTAKKILRNPANQKFVSLAALLLLRKNSPSEVFKSYLKPIDFCQNWLKIKRLMQKDTWGSPRVHFWQAVYERVKEKLAKKGFEVQCPSLSEADPFCLKVGQRIRQIRKSTGLTQKELAKKLRISQQIISRIEKGRQNISITTLNNIVKVLGEKIEIVP